MNRRKKPIPGVRAASRHHPISRDGGQFDRVSPFSCGEGTLYLGVPEALSEDGIPLEEDNLMGGMKPLREIGRVDSVTFTTRESTDGGRSTADVDWPEISLS